MKPRMGNSGDEVALSSWKGTPCKPRYRVSSLLPLREGSALLSREEAGLSPVGTKPLVQGSWAVVENEDRDHDTLPG